MNAMVTKNKLDFLSRPWDRDFNYHEFKVGTVHGLWKPSLDGMAYEILAIVNEEKGNGHFEDVMEWFEYSCKRDGKKLRFLEIINERFKKHLIGKRGFKECGNEEVEKTYEN